MEERGEVLYDTIMVDLFLGTTIIERTNEQTSSKPLTREWEQENNDKRSTAVFQNPSFLHGGSCGEGKHGTQSTQKATENEKKGGLYDHTS
jgi:hypothetical protein